MAWEVTQHRISTCNSNFTRYRAQLLITKHKTIQQLLSKLWDNRQYSGYDTIACTAVLAELSKIDVFGGTDLLIWFPALFWFIPNFLLRFCNAEFIAAGFTRKLGLLNRCRCTICKFPMYWTFSNSTINYTFCLKLHKGCIFTGPHIGAIGHYRKYLR